MCFVLVCSLLEMATILNLVAILEIIPITIKLEHYYIIDALNVFVDNFIGLLQAIVL